MLSSSIHGLMLATQGEKKSSTTAVTTNTTREGEAQVTSLSDKEARPLKLIPVQWMTHLILSSLFIFMSNNHQQNYMGCSLLQSYMLVNFDLGWHTPPEATEGSKHADHKRFYCNNHQHHQKEKRCTNEIDKIQNDHISSQLARNHLNCDRHNKSFSNFICKTAKSDHFLNHLKRW